MKTIILAGGFWNGLTPYPLGYTEIKINDGKIIEVGKKVTRESDTKIIDLSEQFVLPGFIDCHVHLSGSNIILANLMESNDAALTLAGINACKVLLHNGFTTVRDVGDLSFVSWIVPTLKKAVESGSLQGPRIICGGHMISAIGGHFDFGGRFRNGITLEQENIAEGVDSLRRAVHNEIRHGADWIKFAASGGFLSPSDEPDDVSYSQVEMTAIVQAAIDEKKKICVHAYDNESVRRAAIAGVHSIEHGNMALIDTLEMLVQKNIYIVPTQYAVVNWCRHDDPTEPEYVREKKAKYKERILECAGNIAQSNVKIAFGTDLGTYDYTTNGSVEFSEMLLNGISPLRALKAATSTAAEMLNLNVGSIINGKNADIIAMPENPFEDISATEKVNFVMKGGIVYRNDNN